MIQELRNKAIKALNIALAAITAVRMLRIYHEWRVEVHHKHDVERLPAP